jgi:hypothetical protein
MRPRRLEFVFAVAALLVACRPRAAPLAPVDPTPAAPVAPIAPVVTPDPAPSSEPMTISPSGEGRCERDVAPLERRVGDLVVHAPPDTAKDPNFRGRLRAHSEGSLGRGETRIWVGPSVPGFVPLSLDTAELFLLERDGDVDVALYRDPYGASSCNLDSPNNCRFVVRGFRDCQPIYTLELGEYLSRKDRLEVQDLRVDDGVAYFNEACQSYSKEAGGKCSALLAVDTGTGKLLWRTKPRVSNNRFLVLERHIISGYGFTDEPDALFVIRRSDGEVMHRVKLKTAHDDLVLEGADRLTVRLYDSTAQFELRGFDGETPTLVPVGASRSRRPGG